MQRENIISKGYYTHPQLSGLISVSQYIVLSKDNEKVLLLRMNNDKNEEVTGYSFRVLQYNAAGNLISEQTVEQNDLSYAPGVTFTVDQRITISDDCVDFKVAIISVKCGRYLYVVKDEEIVSSYVIDDDIECTKGKPQYLKKMKGEGQKLSPRVYHSKKVIFGISAIIISLMLLLTAIHLMIFMRTETIFTLDNVEYQFESDNRTDGPICINGYNGSAWNIIIPKEVEGHKVVRISERAFSNSHLRTIVIEGDAKLDNYSFTNAKYLKSVEINNVTSVGKYAFSNCANLESVSMKANNSTINKYAFQNCRSLKSVKLPDTMNYIGEGAFSGCTSLSEFIIPNQILSMGEGILYDCHSLVNLSIPYLGLNQVNNAPLNSIFSLAGEVKTPHGVLNLTVTNEDSVDNNAFYQCSYLKTVSFTKDITRIGDSAFYECNNLEAFNFSGELVYLGDNAFLGCSSLKSIDIGQNLTEIGTRTFKNCTSLKTVELSQSIKLIGDAAFENCSGLTELYIPKSVEYIEVNALRGCNSLRKLTVPFLGRSKDEPMTLSGFLDYDKCVLEELVILKGTSLLPNAFSGITSLNSVVLSSDLVVIGESAFSGCTSLKTVVFPYNTLKTIENYAFENCTSLQDATLPVSVTYLGSNVFYNCSSLKKVVLPSTLKTIPEYTFNGCSSLTTVNIPENVISIGDYAFSECSQLKQVLLPAALTSLGNNSFSKCTSLETISIPSKTTTIPEHTFFNCTSLNSVNLPSSLKVIENNAFYGCVALNNIKFPSSLERFGEYSFRNTGLTEVVIPNSVRYIGKGVFAQCNSLKSLTAPFLGTNNAQTQTKVLGYFFTTSSSYSNNSVPSTLTSVTILDDINFGNGVFKNCSYLTDIKLPEYLNSIPQDAFYSCRALKYLELPDSIVSLGSSAFYGCVSLESIDIPDNLQTIGANSFRGCSSLKEIIIPGSVDSIGNGAFYNCTNLTKITLPFVGESRDTAGNFGYIFSNTVPSSLKTVELTDAVIIPSNAFTDCKNITAVILPQNLREVGDYAFSNCSKLEQINLPDTLNVLGNYVFSNCNSLKSLVIPDSVNKIGSKLFSNCTSLEELSIPFIPQVDDNGWGVFYSMFNGDPTSLKKVTLTNDTYVPYQAFRNCTNLKEVNFVKSLSYIGDYAFYNCRNLRQIELSSTLDFIGNYAFSGCYKLYVVTNESKFDFKNEYDRTQISNYALTILDKGESPITVKQDGFVFLLGDDGNWYLVEYEGSSSKLILPERFDYYSITIDSYRIPAYAYEGNDFISELNLSSASIVGNNAFEYCVALKSVVVPKSVQSIEFDAFFGCINLQEVYNLSDLNIVVGSYEHGSVAYYAYVVHKSITAEPLTEITIQQMKFKKTGNQWFLSKYEGNATDLVLDSFTYDGKKIYKYKIMSGAFRNNETLNTIIINNVVTEIGKEAFAYCYNLKSVTLPTTLNKINDYTFMYCQNLTSVYIPEKVQTIGQNSFRGCYNLKTLTFGANSQLRYIDNYAFSDCRMLEEIVLPDGLQEIGYSAFSNCLALNYVRLPSSLTNIYSSAFHNSKNILEVVNLSSLPIVAKSADYGQVSYYALAVIDSEDSRLPRKTISSNNSTYKFICSESVWYLYSIQNSSDSNKAIMELPVLIENDKVIPYHIICNALDSAYYDLVIPESVISIDTESQNTLYNKNIKVYYAGTKNEWDALITIPESIPPLFYAECVHESGQWSYRNNSIVTTKSTKTIVVVKPATCAEEGLKQEKCNNCSAVWDIVIEKTNHTLDSEHICTVCNKVATKVTLDNINSVISIKNDLNNPFSISKDGVITSGNVPRPISTLTINADRKLQIDFEYGIQSDTGADRVQIYLNGSLVTTLQASDPNIYNYKVTLKEGDVLMIRYRNSGGSNTISGSAVIQNFYVI